MKLSYIVPVYKVEEYLNECIDSILAQSMDDYEIILVNDGSPDNCPAICVGYEVRYPDRIRVVHKKNGGLASARNAGLRVAKGDYIFFIDSDDFLKEDRVKDLYEAAVRFDADVLQTSYFVLNTHTNEETMVRTTFETDRVLTHTDMERELCYVSSKMRVTYVWRNLYKRKFLRENNIMFEEGLLMVEDGPFNMEAYSKAERFVAVDIPVLCYRLRQGSLQRLTYVPGYDKWICWNWSLKMKYYTENCKESQLFYEDLAEYTVRTLFYEILKSVYCYKPEESFTVLKRLGNSEMMRRSFADYDINKFKSKSLDWVMTKLVLKKHYFAAHLLCKHVLYK